MNEDKNRDGKDENSTKVLFFILTRFDGESKRIDMNKEVIEHDERFAENHNRFFNR